MTANKIPIEVPAIKVNVLPSLAVRAIEFEQVCVIENV